MAKKPIKHEDIYGKDPLSKMKEYGRRLMQRSLGMSMVLYSRDVGKN